MRIDKLTTKFQEALSDAQSLALGNDHAYIEPAHVLAAWPRTHGAEPEQLPHRADRAARAPSSAAVRLSRSEAN